MNMVNSAFVKRLTTAGMPEAQAEVLADEQVKLLNQKLAAKTDPLNLASKVDVSDARSDIIKWIFGTIGCQTLIIIGAVIDLARVVHP